MVGVGGKRTMTRRIKPPHGKREKKSEPLMHRPWSLRIRGRIRTQWASSYRGRRGAKLTSSPFNPVEVDHAGRGGDGDVEHDEADSRDA